MTNINTHRRCETCDAWDRADDADSWVPYGHCRATPPQIMVIGLKTFTVYNPVIANEFCRQWFPSPDYQASRGLMTPAVSNALVEACKAFIDDTTVRRDMDEWESMADNHAGKIADALKQQGVEV